jgi:lactoylglutathione lyase
MRILHTMLRVGNLDKSLGFLYASFGYEAAAAQRLSRRQVYAGFRWLSRMKQIGAVLELTHNWDTASEYDSGRMATVTYRG